MGQIKNIKLHIVTDIKTVKDFPGGTYKTMKHLFHNFLLFLTTICSCITGNQVLGSTSYWKETPMKKSSEEHCVPRDSCSCITRDRYIVSLWPLDDPEDIAFPNVGDPKENSTFVFDYSPCTTFSENATKTHTCDNVLLCQRDPQTDSGEYAIAKPKGFTTSFVQYNGKTHLAFMYADGRYYQPRHALIILDCDKNANEPSFKFIN